MLLWVAQAFVGMDEIRAPLRDLTFIKIVYYNFSKAV